MVDRERRTVSVGPVVAPYCVFVFIAALLHVAISYGPVYLLHVALVVLAGRLALVLRHADELRANAPRGLLEWSGAVFVAIYLVSWVWSIDRLHSTTYLGYLLIGVATTLATAVLACTRAGLRRLVWLAGVITVVHIGICLLEIATPFRLPVSPFSPYAHFFGRDDKLASIGLFGALLQQLLQSPTGFHWNPNNLAIVMVVAVAFFINVRNPTWRWLGVASAMTVIVFTASRASVLGVLVVLVIYLAVLSPRRLGLTIAMLPPLLLGVWFAGQHLDRIYERLGPVAGAVEAATSLFAARKVVADSIGIRQQLMTNSLESIRATNGVGVGPGGSMLVQKAAGGEAAKIGSSHNFWLEIAVDAGVIALLVFVAWYFTAWVYCLTTAVYSQDPLFSYVARSLACALGGFSVALVSASSVLYFPPMWVMFGVVIGLRRAQVLESQVPLEPVPGRGRQAAVGPWH